jgi:ferredoxin
MRIVADRDRCIAAGQCAFAEPRVFDQDAGDGRVLLLLEQVPGELADSIRLAVSACPSRALRIEPA